MALFSGLAKKKDFAPCEESYQEFKWSYFKVLTQLEVHPFSLTLKGEPKIDIYWRKNGSGVQVSDSELSFLVREIVEFFS